MPVVPGDTDLARNDLSDHLFIYLFIYLKDLCPLVVGHLCSVCEEAALHCSCSHSLMLHIPPPSSTAIVHQGFYYCPGSGVCHYTAVF